MQLPSTINDTIEIEVIIGMTKILIQLWMA